MLDGMNVEWIWTLSIVGGAGISTLALYVVDKVRERKGKKLKPTPRPNRVPYDSKTFRR